MKTDGTTTLQELKDKLKEFCEARDWDQFHEPKDLAIGLITEAAELLEHFRFRTTEQVVERMADSKTREAIEDELADALFFVLRFAERNQIDLSTALERKMVKNARKYPVDLARGSNRKYTEF